MRGGFNAILRIACPYANPNLQIGMVFEIDRGTRVLTHSPNAGHQRRHYRRYQPLSVCAVTSGSRRQCLRSTNSVCHLLIILMFLPRVPLSTICALLRTKFLFASYLPLSSEYMELDFDQEPKNESQKTSGSDLGLLVHT